MNFPPQLQQNIEKWANSQGISTEQFVLQAIAEKIDTLSQQVTEEDTQQNSDLTNILPLNQPNIYRKEGILVVEAELPENFDVNAFIDELREERIIVITPKASLDIDEYFIYIAHENPNTAL